MGRAFAEYLGVEAEFLPLAVANRIPALTTDKVDVLFATMAMSPERAQSIQFSVPYAANQMSVVGPKDADLSTPESLADYRIGVPRSAAQDTALTAMAPESTTIMRFDDDAGRCCGRQPVLYHPDRGRRPRQVRKQDAADCAV